MPSTEELALLKATLRSIAICAVLVIVCYFLVDRPVAFFVHDQGVEKIAVFKWLTYPPPLVQTWSPLILAILIIRRALGAFNRWEWTLFVACVSLIVADEFRTSLGDLFGRYWPETWFDHNPSLIGTDTYGFHPFVTGDDIGSFPSGHAVRILGFASVWWISYPRSRFFLAIVSVPMLMSLIAMDYHFVGDVIAGSCVGGIVGRYASQLGKLSGPAKTIS